MATAQSSIGISDQIGGRDRRGKERLTTAVNYCSKTCNRTFFTHN